jgi:hypothetical protein
MGYSTIESLDCDRYASQANIANPLPDYIIALHCSRTSAVDVLAVEMKGGDIRSHAREQLEHGIHLALTLITSQQPRNMWAVAMAKSFPTAALKLLLDHPLRIRGSGRKIYIKPFRCDRSLSELVRQLRKSTSEVR